MRKILIEGAYQPPLHLVCFTGSPEEPNVFRKKLGVFFQEGPHNYDPISGRNLRQSLGMDGPEKAARAINKLLEQK
jgi:hypothetical protein